MNFDTSRRNYTGLAFVALLHLVAAGIAVKNSTVWISRAEPTPPIDVKPLPPEEKKTMPPEDFEVPATSAPVIQPPVIEFDVKWDVAHTPTPAPPKEGPPPEPGPPGGPPGVAKADPPRPAPVSVAAVIDAASCAKPAYPAAALRNGDEGTVTLAFLVGKDGRVASARVEKTSGYRDLDRAALQGLSMCAFKPGTVDGVAHESWARMQYSWNLDG